MQVIIHYSVLSSSCSLHLRGNCAVLQKKDFLFQLSMSSFLPVLQSLLGPVFVLSSVSLTLLVVLLPSLGLYSQNGVKPKFLLLAKNILIAQQLVFANTF